MPFSASERKNGFRIGMSLRRSVGVVTIGSDPLKCADPCEGHWSDSQTFEQILCRYFTSKKEILFDKLE